MAEIFDKIKEFYDLIDGYLTLAVFIWSVLQYLYYNKMKVYMFITKLFGKWRDTEWDFSITIDVPQNGNILKEIENELKEIYMQKNIKKEMNLANSKMFSLRNFLMKASYDDTKNSENAEVFIEIPKLKTTYAHAKEILDELEVLSKKLCFKLRPFKEVYSMNIKFKNGKNPFIGFMLQRLGKDAIKSLVCELDIDEFIGAKAQSFVNKRATIYRGYINVVQDNIQDLCEVAKKILLLK